MKTRLQKIIVDVGFHIHQQFGPGLLESVCEAVIMHELRKRGLRVVNQVPIPVIWDGERMDVGFRADLIVEHKVLVELKSIEGIHPVHKKFFLHICVSQIEDSAYCSISEPNYSKTGYHALSTSLLTKPNEKSSRKGAKAQRRDRGCLPNSLRA